MANQVVPQLQKAGNVEIEELMLIGYTGKIGDIKSMLIELNIFEDLFQPGLSGNIHLNDTVNMAQAFPIIGEEYIRIKFKTPTFQDSIYKTFRVYSISDRILINDGTAQNYVLHFVSPEVINDITIPIYKTFSGKIDEVAGSIFEEFALMPRNIADTDKILTESEDNTLLVIVTETKNSVKFTSPGWSPFKCINWLASKAIPANSPGAGILFYETTKAFYWVSIQDLIEKQLEQNTISGIYNVSPANVRGGTGDKSINIEGHEYHAPDLAREFFLVEHYEVVENFNHMKSISSGHLANRVITLDLLSKEYEVTNYDHIVNFDQYPHLELNKFNKKGGAMFLSEQIRVPEHQTTFYTKHPHLYTNFTENVNEKIAQINTTRQSLLGDLGSFKINISVPGRSDAEVGQLIYFRYPNVSGKSETDKSKNIEDPYYSGFYLVTALRHKVTLYNHTMTMEIVKDSYKTALE